MVMFRNEGELAFLQSLNIDEAMLQDALKDVPVLRTVWDASQARRLNAADLQAMYDHDWKDQLEDTLRERFRIETYKKLKLMLDSTLNLLFWVVRKLSGIYKKPATRILVEDPTNERFESLLKESNWDMTMLQVNRLTNLHRDLLVGPYVQKKSDGNRRIRFRIITPDMFTVITDPNDPTLVRAVIYKSFVPDDNAVDRDRYYYWDDFLSLEFDQNFNRVITPGNTSGINPFGRIPFVSFHAQLATQKYWHCEQSKGLRQSTLNIGAALTDFWHSLKNNSFKQIALSGEGVAKIDPGAIMDAAQPLDLGMMGKADVLDMNVTFQDRIDSIFAIIGAIVNTYGIQPRSFRSGSDTAMSGYALDIQERDLNESYEEQRRLYPDYEQELYDVTRAVNNANQSFDANGEVIPGFELLPESVMQVIYDDIGPGQSPIERLEFWSKAVDSGLSSHLMAMMRLHDMTLDEAELELARVMQEKRSMSNVPLVPIIERMQPEETNNDSNGNDIFPIDPDMFGE